MLNGLSLLRGAWKLTVNNLTPRRIMVYGLLIILSVLLILHISIIQPLERTVQNNAEVKKLLQEEMDRLTSLQTERTQSIPRSSDLALALDLIRHCFQIYGVKTEEIVITQLSPEGNTEYKQAAVKLWVTGDAQRVLQALTEIQQSNSCLFLFQELDMTQRRTEINLKVLFL